MEKKLALICVSLLGVVLLAGVVACGKPQPRISTAFLPDGYTNIAYSQTLEASGGSGTYSSWFITFGTLPAGLSLDSLTGIISGTPTTAGTSSFTVQVTDSNGVTATHALSINIAAASITSTTNTTSTSTTTTSSSQPTTSTTTNTTTPEDMG